MESLMGRSFVAKLDCFAAQRRSSIALSQEALAGQSGWLEIRNDPARAVELRFRYLRQTQDRYEYEITGTKNAGYYANAALGISINGYLGMYHQAHVDNVWKFDFTPFDGKDFWLRDNNGQRVAVDDKPHQSFAYHPDEIGVPRLNVNKGDIARFTLSGALLT